MFTGSEQGCGSERERAFAFLPFIILSFCFFILLLNVSHIHTYTHTHALNHTYNRSCPDCAFLYILNHLLLNMCSSFALSSSVASQFAAAALQNEKRTFPIICNLFYLCMVFCLCVCVWLIDFLGKFATSCLCAYCCCCNCSSSAAICLLSHHFNILMTALSGNSNPL